MTEPTTERGAWLEEVRADVERAQNSPVTHRGDLRRYEAQYAVAMNHAPAMLRALEAVEAVLATPRSSLGLFADDDAFEAGALSVQDDIRKTIDEARGRA